MTPEDIRFKTYSWSYGSTSFRASELKYKIERQLLKLKQLHNENEIDYCWGDLQTDYFEMLLGEEWFNSEATEQEEQSKYARQVSSSLKDLGLVSEERRLTRIGEELSRILLERDFNFDNIFGIRNDSYLYLKQFLKIEFSEYSNSRNYSEFSINPFIAITYFISELGDITKDELTYLLPIQKNYDELRNLVIRRKEGGIMDLFSEMKNKISSKQNYNRALSYFVENDTTLETFKVILVNRKSPRSAPKYKRLYHSLEEGNIENVISAIQDMPSGQKGKYYRQLFNLPRKPTHSTIQEARTYFEALGITENLKENFFYLVHIAKWMANLEEYFDLNKRFLTLTDIFIFEDQIKLTPVADIYFKKIGESLLNTELANSIEEYNEKLTTNIEIATISPYLSVDDDIILEELRVKYPELSVDSLAESISNILKKEKTDKFKEIIENYFSKENLQELLLKIKNREDEYIKNYLDWECDIPTVFEYVIGVVWYLLNNQQDDVTDFLNMSLDVNLLPRRFAGGGQSDLVFKYGSHSALIEVTLSQKENQRRMELEPVSRHLGKYRLETGNDNDYAIFIAPYLDPNVLVNFRSYKSLKYYKTNDTRESVESLKIIPFSIDDIILILEKGYDKDNLEEIMEECFISSERDGLKWYREVLQPRLNA